MNWSLLKVSVAAVAVAAVSLSAQAANYSWTGGGTNTNYSTPANWGSESAYPGTGDGAMFIGDAASKTVTFDGVYSPDWVWVATRDVSKPVTWEADDSENGMTVSGNIGVADGDNTDGAQVGALKILSGTYKANGIFKVGYGAATAAKVEILGGSVTVNGSEAETFLDNALPNGTFAAKIGSGLGFAADITVQDAAVSFPNGDIGLGFWGAWPDAYDSETVNTNHLAVGYLTVDVNTNGTLSCGTEESPRGLFLGGYGVEPITVNINQGGTLCVGRIYRLYASNGSVNINGGTIKVLGSYNGAFIANDGIAYTVDGNATLNTNGKEITIAAVIGGTGTLNIIGDGKVTFTAEPTCTVMSSDDTPFVRPSDNVVYPEGAYYWIGGATGDWRDGNNWSFAQNGAAANAFPDNQQEAVAVIVDACTITVAGGNANAKQIICDRDVTFTGSGQILAYSISGTGTVAFDSGKLRTPAIDWATYQNLVVSNNIIVVGDNDFQLSSSTRYSGGYLLLNGNISGSGSINVSNSSVNDSKGESIRFAGDNSGFTGTYTMNRSKGSRGNNSYANKFLSPASGSADATWNIFFGGEPSTSDGLFEFSDGEIEFGSLNTRMPAFTSTAYSNNTIKVGALGKTDNVSGSWGVSAGNTIYKVGTGTLNFAVANTAALKIGGGMVNVADDGSLNGTAVSFIDDGGILSLPDGATIAPVFKDSSEPMAVSVPAGANATLAGEIAASNSDGFTKTGAGSLSFNAVTTGLVDLNVQEGEMVCAKGAAFADVTVPSDASLVVDVTGGIDDEVVFTYASVSGDVSLRGLDSSAAIATNTVDGTTTWTISRAAKTYTWNGADGADWTVAANWLVDDEEATSMPTADDTLIFTGSASVYVPWESRSVGTVQVQSGTLTVNPGVIFASLTLENGAKLAFDMSGWNVGAVGASSELVTVNAGNVTVNDIVAPANCTAAFADGVFTATRVASTYTWAGTGTDWSQSASWRVNDGVVGDVPDSADTVVFASDASVTLTGDAAAKAVVVNANVVITGDSHKITTPSVYTENAAAGLLTANGLKIMAPADEDLALSAALNIPTNKVFETEMSSQYHHVHLWAKVTGKGEWRLNQSKTQERGALYCHGDASGDNSGADMSEFAGTVNVYNYSTPANRDNTRFWGALSTSSNAVWNLVGYNKVHDHGAMLRNNNTTYYFGALSGSVYASGDQQYYNRNTWEIGAREDVDSVLTGNLFVNNYPGLIPTRGDTIRKVGGSKLTFSGSCVRDYEINGGTLEMTSPSTLITYFVEGDKGRGTITSNPAEATASVRSTISFKLPGGTLRLTDQNLVDPSSVITNSTAPIAVDDGDVDRTWATALDGSNTNGLTKAGTGTLTLEKEPYYTGVTWVQDGKLVVPEGTSITLDPRSHGTVSGGTVTGYAYRPDTVLDGTEEDDDNRDGNIDVSGIRKIDIHDLSFVDVLRNQKRVVLCGTTGSITGLDFRHFVQGETLLVPERPEEVSEKNWDWAVRVMRIGDKNCLCVAPRVVPFAIRIR